jgi:hypothetical protein
MPFETIQKFGKSNVEATVTAFGAVSKGAQAIAAEGADYARKSFEQGTATLEKLLGAKSLEKAIEIQTDYLKTSYEGFVAQATKVGGLYADLAKTASQPFAAAIAGAPAAKAGK